MIANSIKNMKQEMKGSEQPGINECTVYFVHLETGSVFKSEEFLLVHLHKVLSIVFKTTLYFRLILPGGDADHPAVVPDAAGPGTGHWAAPGEATPASCSPSPACSLVSPPSLPYTTFVV